MRLDQFWVRVEEAVGHGDRYGQAMFNILYAQGILPETFVGSLDDPYYRIKTRSSAKSWVARFLTEKDGKLEFNLTAVQKLK